MNKYKKIASQIARSDMKMLNIPLTDNSCYRWGKNGYLRDFKKWPIEKILDFKKWSSETTKRVKGDLKMLYRIGDKGLQTCEKCEGIEEMEFRGYDITKIPIKETWKCKNCNEINELHIKQ